jgi:CheY-like chemotaxis protein
VARLLRLVNSLLDFSRIEASQVLASFEPTDLAAYTAELAGAYRSACERAGLRLEMDCSPLVEQVYVDREMWEKVVLNLISNALKFTFEGEIAVSVRRVGDSAELRVSDTGTSIPAEEMPRLFERFHRLSLVRTLVEMHGGAVEAHSEGPGRGSEFVIRLPAAPASIPCEASGRTPIADAPHGPERHRILVVDDNEDAANSLARVLARLYGQDVRVAHDCPSALGIAPEFRPEVVLLDIGMPGMDGHEVARRLRQGPETGGVLLVAPTGWGQESDRRQSRDSGFDLHLVKPVDAEQIRDLIAGAGKAVRPDHSEMVDGAR